MANDATLVQPVGPPPQLAVPARPVRFWPAVVFVGLAWASLVLPYLADTGMFLGFLVRAGACLLATLLFVIWWLTNRGLSVADRLLAFGAAVGGGVACGLLAHPSLIPPPWLMTTLPLLLTTWTAWWILAGRTSARTRRLGFVAVAVLVWAPVLFVRMDGLEGDGAVALHWRWTPSAEERFLATRATRGAAVVAEPARLTQSPGDWPGFRGAGRDGAVHGLAAAPDWTASPPKLLWRQRVGPAWSSFVVIGKHVFTQEQRDESEAVVCLDAASGREIWAHEDAARFYERLAGAGPRATPAFADGRLYTLGATGILNCLDAATGERQWARNIAADSGAKLPMWGFTSSPLVAGGLVVVFAGGDGPKQLLAYRADSGELAWSASVGQMSYSSPQLVSIAGVPQVLFFSERGLTAVRLENGAALWSHEAPGGGPGLPRSLQPQLVGKSQLLIASEDLGAQLLDVSRSGETWTASLRWASKALRPPFNDFVIHAGAVYGFDGGVFCCADLETGKRLWKAGRYGRGQVLLLAGQGQLLVLTERGEAVLLATNRERHEELGRFEAIEGKTWNHPAVAHGRLYVRNAEEMACYDLTADRPR